MALPWNTGVMAYLITGTQICLRYIWTGTYEPILHWNERHHNFKPYKDLHQMHTLYRTNLLDLLSKCYTWLYSTPTWNAPYICTIFAVVTLHQKRILLHWILVQPGALWRVKVQEWGVSEFVFYTCILFLYSHLYSGILPIMQYLCVFVSL